MVAPSVPWPAGQQLNRGGVGWVASFMLSLSWAVTINHNVKALLFILGSTDIQSSCLNRSKVLKKLFPKIFENLWTNRLCMSTYKQEQLLNTGSGRITSENWYYVGNKFPFFSLQLLSSSDVFVMFTVIFDALHNSCTQIPTWGWFHFLLHWDMPISSFSSFWIGPSKSAVIHES